MDLMYWAMIVLVAFVAIWMLFVAPAERRHHERKLELLQKKIEQRQASNNTENNESLTDQDNDLEES
jgi:flagellar biosynthesis/type III secretory pathway M-ring protein FliF/YscJ